MSERDKDLDLPQRRPQDPHLPDMPGRTSTQQDEQVKGGRKNDFNPQPDTPG